MTDPITVRDEMFCFVDFESTGKHCLFDRLIEVGVILTDGNLVEIARYESLVDPGELGWSRMEPGGVVAKMHAASGLLDALASAGPLPSLRRVELEILALLAAHPARAVTLAGSGVAAFDMQFIRYQMPRLAEELNYFSHDVGILRRAWRRAAGSDLVEVNKAKPHRAMVDIDLHLQEARAFKTALELAAAFVVTATPEEASARLAAFRGETPAAANLAA